MNQMVEALTIKRAERSHYDAERSRHVATQTVFSEITETLGTTFVPDLFATLERKPAYLEVAWEVFRDEVGLDALDARTKHIIALAVTANRSGTYLICSLPQAFRLSPLGPKRCETILSVIEMLDAFTRYLSDMAALHTETTDIGYGFA